MLKAEHAEAIVVVGNLSPPECAKELRVKYGMNCNTFININIDYLIIDSICIYIFTHFIYLKGSLLCQLQWVIKEAICQVR